METTYFIIYLFFPELLGYDLRLTLGKTFLFCNYILYWYILATVFLLFLFYYCYLFIKKTNKKKKAKAFLMVVATLYFFEIYIGFIIPNYGLFSLVANIKNEAINSKNYNIRGFSKIQYGWPSGKVIKALGMPLSTEYGFDHHAIQIHKSPKLTTWFYVSPTNYYSSGWVVAIQFDNNLKVINKLSYFYFY